MHCLILTTDTRYALIKTLDIEQAKAIAQLCSEHLLTLFPEGKVTYTKDVRMIESVENHPDKRTIINAMRDLALPRRQHIIEATYSVD